MANVSILDINGSQWNFKDTEARSLITETNTNLTTLTNRVNKLFYSTPTNCCCAQIAIGILTTNSVEIDLLSLFPDKSPPRGAFFSLTGRLNRSGSGFDVNIEAYNSDKTWSAQGANITLAYTRSNRHLKATPSNNAYGIFNLNIAFAWI